MAFIGLPYYGYCPVTVTTAKDGTESEALGAGKITRTIISYAGENDSDSSELWAGDRREQHDTGEPSAKLSIERSHLTLEEEAELCGHSYEEAPKTLPRKSGDTAIFVRVAALCKMSLPERKKGYRMLGYYRASFEPVNDTASTANKSVSYGTPKLTGTAETNAEGLFEIKQDFDTYAEALTAFKRFLNITE